MKTTKGATRADFKMKLNGSASLGLIKESLDADLANLQMAGTASGTVASVDGGKRSTQKIAATPVSLNLPIGADGTWTLEMNIAPVGTKYTGSGSAAICGCKTYPITVSGAYNSRMDTSKLILNGQRAAHLVLTANFQNGAIQVQSLKGTMLGQKPHVP